MRDARDADVAQTAASAVLKYSVNRLAPEMHPTYALMSRISASGRRL